jgi:hypothetical protein
MYLGWNRGAITKRGVLSMLDRDIAYVKGLPPTDHTMFGGGDDFVTAAQALALLNRKRAAAVAA